MRRRTMPKGWHPELIKAEVRMRGKTLTQLALDNDLYGSACRVALMVPAYRAEQVIAEFIGVPAQELWPSRYDPDGTPRHPRSRPVHNTTNVAKPPRQAGDAA